MPASPLRRPSSHRQIPKAQGGAKGKKKKGVKVDSAALLGFSTGTNYAVLETPE